MCTVVCSVHELGTWLRPYLRAFWSCTLSSAWHRWEQTVWGDLLFTKVNGVCRVSSWHNCLVLSAPVPSLTWRAGKTGKRSDLPAVYYLSVALHFIDRGMVPKSIWEDSSIIQSCLCLPCHASDGHNRSESNSPLTFWHTLNIKHSPSKAPQVSSHIWKASLHHKTNVFFQVAALTFGK